MERINWLPCKLIMSITLRWNRLDGDWCAQDADFTRDLVVVLWCWVLFWHLYEFSSMFLLGSSMPHSRFIAWQVRVTFRHQSSWCRCMWTCRHLRPLTGVKRLVAFCRPQVSFALLISASSVLLILCPWFSNYWEWAELLCSYLVEKRLNIVPNNNALYSLSIVNELVCNMWGRY